MEKAVAEKSNYGEGHVTEVSGGCRSGLRTLRAGSHGLPVLSHGTRYAQTAVAFDGPAGLFAGRLYAHTPRVASAS